ncbi:MAG TPA: ribonuclease H-like YkuK family protein [Patescibacteria group bacterium]
MSDIKPAENVGFNSPTYGNVSFDFAISKISEFVDSNLDRQFRIIVGADSQLNNIKKSADFVVAIIIHRVGNGGIYFWKRMNRLGPYALKQRMIEEALLSLETAYDVLQALGRRDGLLEMMEIHVDVGQKGPTREVISEVVGMVRGNGFNVKIKPDAYAASKVADRHT